MLPVLDIGEQYPLSEETLAIVQECGIRYLGVPHLTKRRTQILVTMITDFAITIAEGLEHFDQVQTVKYAQDLPKTRFKNKDRSWG